jgi:nucleoside-diphosphate-sugar epimerase
MDKNGTVLVTGISGFIAKHCALELLKQGYRVRGTLRDLKKAGAIKATLARHGGDPERLEFAQADLMDDAGWSAAMQGVSGVQHLASPFPLAQPRDAELLVKPAVDGTLRVMRAAVAAGVPRLVQTSSFAAIGYGLARRNRAFTEDDWSDPEGPGITPYAKSKTLAERAARDFAARHPALHYASVNPGMVLGPLLDAEPCSSAEALAMFLRGKYPACPRLSLPMVDVRDVALMHRLALELPQLPSGGRYIAASSSAWFADMMKPIRAQLGRNARKVPTAQLPNFLVRLIGLVDAEARAIGPDLGVWLAVDNRRTREALGLTHMIPMEEAAPALARSVVEQGLV